MKYLPQRKSNRLKDYDYSNAGYYFLTICVKDRYNLLGRIHSDNTVILSKHGKIVKERIETIAGYFPYSSVVKYVIMPNHIHLIIRLSNNDNLADSNNRTNMTIPRIVSTFKRLSNKEIGFNLWQRSYHDHIIRNEEEYTMIWDYIENNPANWTKDCFFNAKND